MPFTLSHVAAALPVYYLVNGLGNNKGNSLRHWLPFTALAIGCMLPDLVLFLPWLALLGIDYDTTHHWLNLFWVAPLLGWPLLLLVGLLIRPSLACLPANIRLRLPPTTLWPDGGWFNSIRWFVGSQMALIIGALSHSVWDAFTHSYGWGLDVLPLLREPVWLSPHIAGYQLAQHASSIIGLGCLLVVAAVWVWRQPYHPTADHYPLSPKIRTLLWVTGVIIVTLTAGFALTSNASLSTGLFYWITSATRLLAALLLLHAVGYHCWWYLRKAL